MHGINKQYSTVQYSKPNYILLIYVFKVTYFDSPA